MKGEWADWQRAREDWGECVVPKLKERRSKHCGINSRANNKGKIALLEGGGLGNMSGRGEGRGGNWALGGSLRGREADYKMVTKEVRRGISKILVK